MLDGLVQSVSDASKLPYDRTSFFTAFAVASNKKGGRVSNDCNRACKKGWGSVSCSQIFDTVTGGLGIRFLLLLFILYCVVMAMAKGKAGKDLFSIQLEVNSFRKAIVCVSYIL